jgi:hypothetical protein
MGNSRFALSTSTRSLIFETDDGRTFAGAVASFLKFVVVIAFFLKPLSVTLPFAARFTEGEAASRARKRIENMVNAKTVTAAGGWREPLARFLMSPQTLGWLSDQ